MSTYLQSDHFQVRTYDVDASRRMCPPALIRTMHESAMQHVLRLGLSVWDLDPHQLSWVLLRQSLRIHRMPRLNEVINIQTNPTGYQKVFTTRDYRAFAENGELLASSSSVWLLMDLSTRRMTSIPDFIRELFEEILPSHPDKLVPPLDKLQSLDRAEHYHDYTVQQYDLDFNAHLNNVHYLKWMLEALPSKVFEGMELLEAQVHYRRECRLGDEVRASTQSLPDDCFLHRLADRKTGEDIALAETFWATKV